MYPFRPSPANTALAGGGGSAGATSDQHRQGGSRRQATGGSGGTRPTTTTGSFNPRMLSHPELPPQAWIPAGAGSGSAATGATIGSPSRVGTAPATGSGSRGLRQPGAGPGPDGEEGAGRGKATSRAARAAAKRRQDRVGERLADATAAPPDPAGFERSEFLCADGVTLMPYAVVGTGPPLLSARAAAAQEQEEEGRQARGVDERDLDQNGEGEARRGVLSFVVVHDFFDTLEKTFLLFKPLVLKYPGCQILCFNSPGQAWTRLPPGPEGLLTNTWLADRLDELMQVTERQYMLIL